MSGILYVTGTPIGNLEDITLRQLRILKEVDFIAAEDTRVTRKLLTHFDLHTKLTSCNEHSNSAVFEEIADRIQNGENCAVVTDAGMPCISDPGERLVKVCRERGIRVESVPGASAVITALSVCGGSTARFTFYGFLPTGNRVKKERNDIIQELAHEQKTAVLYEAPHKLCKTLEDLSQVLDGNRVISFCRELTKIHEEVLRMTLMEAVSYYQEHEPRGEFVLVLDGADPEQQKFSLEDAVKLANSYLEEGISPTLACKRSAKETGISRQEIYKALHQE